jgi:HAD superfamily 5'-nucleotidase-like hydrolase
MQSSPVQSSAQLPSDIADDIKNLGVGTRTIRDYQVVGFDMDHTLARYKLPALYELLLDAFCQELCEHRNYPKEIFPNPDDKEFELGMIGRTVVDLKTGNLLKVGEGKAVLMGYNGFRLLADAEIRANYGENPVLDTLDVSTMKGEGLRTFNEFYNTQNSLIWAKAIHLKNSGKFPI